MKKNIKLLARATYNMLEVPLAFCTVVAIIYGIGLLLMNTVGLVWGMMLMLGLAATSALIAGIREEYNTLLEEAEYEAKNRGTAASPRGKG